MPTLVFHTILGSPSRAVGFHSSSGSLPSPFGPRHLGHSSSAAFDVGACSGASCEPPAAAKNAASNKKQTQKVAVGLRLTRFHPRPIMPCCRQIKKSRRIRLGPVRLRRLPFFPCFFQQFGHEIDRQNAQIGEQTYYAPKGWSGVCQSMPNRSLPRDRLLACNPLGGHVD